MFFNLLREVTVFFNLERKSSFYSHTQYCKSTYVYPHSRSIIVILNSTKHRCYCIFTLLIVFYIFTLYNVFLSLLYLLVAIWNFFLGVPLSLDLRVVGWQGSVCLCEFIFLHSWSIFFPRSDSRLTLPWLVWLSGLSTGLQTKGSPFRFPVRAHPSCRPRSPVRGTQEATTLWCFSPSLSPFLSLCLKINKIFFRKMLG